MNLSSNINHGANWRLPLDTQNAGKPSALNGLDPLTSTGGSVPWTPDRGSAPDSRYRLALRAYHGIQLNHVQF